MNASSLKLPALLLVAALCSCSANKNKINLEEAQANYRIGQNCRADGETYPPYHNPMPKPPFVRFVMPEEAKAQKISGCATVKFQLDAEGHPTNLTLLREYPADVGYGKAVMDHTRNSIFAPPASPDDMYLINAVFNMDKPADQ